MSSNASSEFPYLIRLLYVNAGPLDKIEIKPRFDHEGNPIPLVFVGMNGAGKSVLLSNITDALYEVAALAYSNAKNPSNGFASAYYKLLSSDQIKIGSDYLYVHLSFTNGKGYVFTDGNLSFAEARNLDPELVESLRWNEEERHHKGNDFTENESRQIFEGNAVCHFGPSRYERPNWIGESYYQTTSGIDSVFSTTRRFVDKLVNPISVEHCADDTARWLLDLIADSRCDVEKSETDDAYHIVHFNSSERHNLPLLTQGRRNVEAIMSKIIGEDVYFTLRIRAFGYSRFSVRRAKDNAELIHSLNALSTGQLALFELFATIIRYADAYDVNKSVHPGDISGIVTIDEADLHLHVELQHHVLPALMRMFPKVQFIITTHSPMLLLGLSKEFGASGVDIYELPGGSRVDAESCSQFEDAYTHFEETERHRKELSKIIEAAETSTPNKPLIITEGTTDWRHIKAARAALKNDDRYADLFDVDYDFLEFGPENDDRCAVTYNMGGDVLLKVCEHCALANGQRPLVFIADRDKDNVVKSFGHAEGRSWGNNVYSLTLPVPSFRESNPDICIEQMYPDEVMKMPVTLRDGIPRRLFTKDEFSEFGNGKDGYRCVTLGVLKGSGSNVLDSSKTTIVKDEIEANFALSKTGFANAVLDGDIPLPNGAFDAFVPLFKAIHNFVASEGKEVGALQ